VVVFPLRETTRIVMGTTCENAIGVGIIGELLLDDMDIVYETLLPTGGLKRRRTVWAEPGRARAKGTARKRARSDVTEGG
jgi:hypothetical protein